MKEKLEGWKTRIYAVAVALLGVAVIMGKLTPEAQESALLSIEQLLGGLIVVIAAGIAGFRQITNKPAGG